MVREIIIYPCICSVHVYSLCYNSLACLITWILYLNSSSQPIFLRLHFLPYKKTFSSLLLHYITVLVFSATILCFRYCQYSKLAKVFKKSKKVVNPLSFTWANRQISLFIQSVFIKNPICELTGLWLRFQIFIRNLLAF